LLQDRYIIKEKLTKIIINKLKNLFTKWRRKDYISLHKGKHFAVTGRFLGIVGVPQNSQIWIDPLELLFLRLSPLCSLASFLHIISNNISISAVDNSFQLVRKLSGIQRFCVNFFESLHLQIFLLK